MDFLPNSTPFFGMEAYIRKKLTILENDLKIKDEPTAGNNSAYFSYRILSYSKDDIFLFEVIFILEVVFNYKGVFLFENYFVAPLWSKTFVLD